MEPTQEPSFKLYRIDSDALQTPGYAICAVYRNPSGYLRAESFLLLHNIGSDVEPIGRKTAFPFIIDQPLKLDEAFAEEEALRQAELDFATSGKTASSSSVDHSSKTEFVEIPVHRMFLLWSEDAYKDALSRIAYATECHTLESYIDALRRIPPMKSTLMDI